MKKSQGFSLVEIIVVTAIILLFTALILPNYKAGQLQYALRLSSQRLALDLRRVQNLAMSTAGFDDRKAPKGGYGIFFDSSKKSYFLFADCNGSKDYTNTGSPCETTGADESEKIEEIKLETGVRIKSINGVGSGYVIFVPPDPSVIINGVATTAGTLDIVLCLEEDCSNKNKIISVNGVGMIDITD